MYNDTLSKWETFLRDAKRQADQKRKIWQSVYYALLVPQVIVSALQVYIETNDTFDTYRPINAMFGVALAAALAALEPSKRYVELGLHRNKLQSLVIKMQFYQTDSSILTHDDMQNIMLKINKALQFAPGGKMETQAFTL